MTLFPGFEPKRVNTRGPNTNLVHGGKGPPVPVLRGKQRVIERAFKLLAEWRGVARNLTGRACRAGKSCPRLRRGRCLRYSAVCRECMRSNDAAGRGREKPLSIQDPMKCLRSHRKKCSMNRLRRIAKKVS